jgi:hypothetical protein
VIVTSRWTVIVVVAALARSVAAQPAPAPPKPGSDAKSLMQSGVRLFEAKDYLGALAVFKDAYARFPSAKILLNIGTTLTALDRKAEAANAYQKYLDSADADPAKKPEVVKVLADLDKVVGQLQITVTPGDAEVQVNDGDYVPAADAKLVRVDAGPYRVRVRKDKFQPEAKSAQIAAGQSLPIAFTMTAVPDPIGVGGGGGRGGSSGGSGGGITANGEPAKRSRIGATALAHLDIPRGGGAALIGVTADVVPHLEVQGAAILGPNYGGYAGACGVIVQGTYQPYVAVGMPIFFSGGARFAVRGAGGVELQVNRRVALIAELGLEYVLNPENDIYGVHFIPALGATGRM